MSDRTMPKIVMDDPSPDHGWLDLECPSCKSRNRIGVTCPENGKPCGSCGETIDFWAAWNLMLHEDYVRQVQYDYWSMQ